MLYYLVLSISFLVAIAGMVRFKRLTMPFKTLTILIIFDFLLTTVGNTYVIKIYKNNALISHIQTLDNYIFYSLVYYQLFRNTLIKTGISILLILITVFFVINAIYLQPYNKVFPSNVVLPTEILFVIFSLLLFKQMLAYPIQVNIIHQSVFWFNTAILFFSTTMFLNLGLLNYYSSHSYNLIVINFWYIVNLIFDVLMGISILTDRKEPATSNATQ
jgi:hypothetical protein